MDTVCLRVLFSPFDHVGEGGEAVGEPGEDEREVCDRYRNTHHFFDTVFAEEEQLFVGSEAISNIVLAVCYLSNNSRPHAV